MHTALCQNRLRLMLSEQKPKSSRWATGLPDLALTPSLSSPPTTPPACLAPLPAHWPPCSTSCAQTSDRLFPQPGTHCPHESSKSLFIPSAFTQITTFSVRPSPTTAAKPIPPLSIPLSFFFLHAFTITSFQDTLCINTYLSTKMQAPTRQQFCLFSSFLKNNA